MFEKTFSSSEEDKAKAIEIIEFIARSCNDRTLRGYISHGEFLSLVRKNAKSLFTICFINHFKFTEDLVFEKFGKNLHELTDEEINILNEELLRYSDEKEILRAYEKFRSSFSLYYLLMTRVYEGRDYRLIQAELESRKPVLVGK